MTKAVDLLRLADARLARLADAVPDAERNMALVVADGFPSHTSDAPPRSMYSPTTRAPNPDEQVDLTPVEAAAVSRRAASDHDDLLRAIGRVHDLLDVVERIVARHTPVTEVRMCTGGTGRLGAESWGHPGLCGDPAGKGSVLCDRHRKREQRWKDKRRTAIETTGEEM